MNEDLVKRFAPILFLHPQEKFVPSDAKRFVENASLWQTKAPLDDKSKWGQSGGPSFPRSPNMQQGELAGIVGEGGTIIDDPMLIATGPGEEPFLELGGWKDAADVHQDGVTATSVNSYADRNAIESLYAQEPLASSRYFFHAEMYDGERLKSLSSEAGAGYYDAYLGANYALLCYYFFFPVHQQSISTPYCNSPIAREFMGHAGDWQCMAILLEGDGTGAATGYQPKYFGCTGHVPHPGYDGQVFRPYQEDDDAYTAMKVERWRPASGPAVGLPGVDGDHPRLYVSLGTHGLYPKPGGTQVIAPFNGNGPQDCGTFETPGLMPEGWGQPENTVGRDALAFVAKIIAGLNLGPFGAIGGLVAAGLEGVIPEPGAGLSVVGTGDVADPDQVPTAGEGIAIAPPGVTPAGAGLNVQQWKMDNTLSIGGRAYPYLVDREVQRWLPDDDNETGFRGRWGQHVEKDFLPRRAGPKFPNFLKMFLRALADGDTRKLFDDL